MKVRSQKLVRCARFVSRICQRLLTPKGFLVFVNLFLKVVLWTNRPFFQKYETIFSNSFLKKMFSILNSRMSKNVSQLGHKVFNGQNLTMEIQFFKGNITDNLCHFFTHLNSRMSRNMRKLRHKLGNAKTGVGPTFTWSNEA